MHGSTPDPVELRLWQRFKQDADQDARDRLIVHYSPLVKFVAGRVRSGLPPSVEQDDLVSDGVIGLMDAVDKFDPDRGLQFQTYAVRRIRGAMIDGLRAADWVPRGVRDRARAIEATRAELAQRLGRPPTLEEVADALGTSVAELSRTLDDAGRGSLLSLDESYDEADVPRAAVELPGADDDLPDGFLAAVRQLPERDQVIVALYYWERFTLAEIGRVLGVTESRVSQLLTRATRSLRATLLGPVV